MRSWKEKLSLVLAVLMLAICISACDPAEPGESTGDTAASNATSVATESTGETSESSAATEETDDSETTGATETEGTEAPTTDPTETTGATQAPETQPTTKPTTPPATTAPPATEAPAATGTAENPAALAMGNNTASTTGKGGYYFTWTATQDGTLTLEMPNSNWAYEVHNLTAGEAVNQASSSRADIPMSIPKVSVLKGDKLEIVINTAKGTKGTVKFTTSFSTDKVGTEKEPFHVSIETVTGIRVPAGQTVYFSGRVYGTTMVVKNAADAKVVFGKDEYRPSNGVISVPIPEAQAGVSQMLSFAITNNSGSVQIYTVEFKIPVGTLNNPDKLTLSSHTVSVKANSQGYVYEWKATADGTLSVQLQGSNWYYQLYNLDSYRVEEGNSKDNSANPVSIAVKAGQVVKITVNTADCKAADVSFTASFQ